MGYLHTRRRNLVPTCLKENIYLVSRCIPIDNPGKRILSLDVEIEYPEILNGSKISLIKYGAGFLTRGATYSVVKLISRDRILPNNEREKILKSKPRFKIIELNAK